MSYTVTIPLEIVNATHRGGYWELYLSYVQQGYASVAAYEMVEADLARHGLPGRFRSYESFRRSMWRIRRDLDDWKREKMRKRVKLRDQ